MSDKPPMLDDPAEIRRMVDARRAEEAARREERQPQPEDPLELHGRSFVLQCLDAADHGDGALYRAANHNRVIYDASAGRWLRWAAHHWEPDVLGAAEILVEEVAEVYAALARATAADILTAEADGDDRRVRYLRSTAAKIRKRISRLRTVAGRKNCLEFARAGAWPGVPSMAVPGNAFDCDPWRVPCGNGVLELRDPFRFRPGKPEDLLVRHTPVEWKGFDFPRPHWDRLIQQATLGDEPKAMFLQRFLGMALIRETIEQVILFLVGGGANSKGTLINTVMEAAGELAAPVPVEMVLASRGVRNSAAPAPDIVSLKGLAIAVLSEPDPGVHWSPGRLKWFTGGDPLTGRSPHDRCAVTFQPSHTFIMLANDKPNAPGQDYAFWRRMHMVHFGAKFVKEPAADNEFKMDKDLPHKLRGELPGVLAWLVEGCLMWQREGLNPPPSVLAETSEYQSTEDLIGAWLDDCCEVGPHFQERATDLFDSFAEWFQANWGRRNPSQKTFGGWLVARFERSTSKPRTYYGLRLQPQ